MKVIFIFSLNRFLLAEQGLHDCLLTLECNERDQQGLEQVPERIIKATKVTQKVQRAVSLTIVGCERVVKYDMHAAEFVTILGIFTRRELVPA